MNALFLFGLLLGWGAAIPIGPVNIEITRRNLSFGTARGLATGFGACSADLTYLVLLSAGILSFLTAPPVLRAVGLAGSLVLGWFGISSLRTSPENAPGETSVPPRSLVRNWLDGYLMTLLNPYTILFWASVSSQVAVVGMGTRSISAATSLWITGIGLVAGTTSWVISLNGILHMTRHRLGPATLRVLNILGGIILLGFSGYGLVRVVGH